MGHGPPAWGEDGSEQQLAVAVEGGPGERDAELLD